MGQVSTAAGFTREALEQARLRDGNGHLGAVRSRAFERMVSEAATLIFDALRRELDVIVSVPHVTLRSDRDGSGAIFRLLALLQAAHEPVALPVERTSIIFNVREGDERKTA